MKVVLGGIYWIIVWVLLWVLLPFNWISYKVFNVDFCPELWFISIAEYLEYKGIIK